MHGCFLPLFRSGATLLKPRFFYFQGLVCLFYSKNRVIYSCKEYFQTPFCFSLLF
ncbi:hypothetical protein BREVNS_0864 [Brevinematales bacterium NS]|nr:hypothetical protein BREVNS_0864 [Brevinematales bacterium NS]